MKRILFATLLLLGTTALQAQGQEQREFPKITADDLAVCKREISDFHREEINYLKNEARGYCTQGEEYYDEHNCKVMNDEVTKSSTQSNLAWYIKGNDSCEGSDYPCFGLEVFNDYGPNLESIWRSYATDPVPDSQGDKFFEAEYAVTKCISKIWVEELDRIDRAMAVATNPVNKSANSAEMTQAADQTTAGLGAAVVLTPQQIDACSDDIKRTQVESQSWGGDVNAVANRLGKYQKDLFEGRCAGHPEAQAYIAGADKMLGYEEIQLADGGVLQDTAEQQRASRDSRKQDSSSANLPPLGRGSVSTEHNEMHNATSCIIIYGPDEIKEKNLHTIMPSKMINSCNYPISVTWCVEAGNGRSGDCNPGYSNLLDLRAGGSYGVDADNQKVHYAACRHDGGWGFQRVEKDPLHPFQFSCS